MISLHMCKLYSEVCENMSRSVLLKLKPLVTPSISSQFKMSTGPTKKYFMLTYNYVDGVLEKRAPLRSNHLKLVKKYVDDGRLVLGGALADPIDKAFVVFRVGDKSEVEEFVGLDPYVQAPGAVVTSWNLREWTVVAGTAFSQTE